MDAVAALSRVRKSNLGGAVVCVRLLGACKTDGTRDGEVGVGAVVYSEGDINVLAEDRLGTVVLAAGRGTEKCVGYFHLSTLGERDRDLDDGSRHIDGDGILSRVVRD